MRFNSLICLLTIREYLMVSLPVPLVLLLLVCHTAGEQHLVPVVTLGAGGVFLNIKCLSQSSKIAINFYVDIILKWNVTKV